MTVFSRALLFVLISSPVWGQTNRYMVFFKDKVGTPHSISDPSTFLSVRSIQRRAKALVATTEKDLPVKPGYVTQVQAEGASTFFTTRWMNGVLIEAIPGIATAIAGLSFVDSVSFVAPNHRLEGGRIAKWSTASGVGTSTAVQLHLHGLDSMHIDGFRGEGVMIAVLDSGFPGVDITAPFQSARDGNQIKLTTDFITNSSDVYQFDDHGTKVFSTIAASASSFQGGAPGADYLLFVTEDVLSEYRVEEYNWLFAAERADSAGADIIQASLGYNEFDDPSMDYTVASLNGSTAIVTRAANEARDRGIVVVASAGNLGGTPWQYIVPPADASSILAVGAINSSGLKAGFSSTGTGVGAPKPDVAALGVGVSVYDQFGALTSSQGTSMAAPLVTSLVAGLIQAYPGLRPQELIDAIKVSSTQGENPDDELGFGKPSYQAVRNYLEPKGGVYGVHPNPVTNLLWLNLTPSMNVVNIAILDHLGKPVIGGSLSIDWSNSPLPIDVSGLGAGLYIVRVTLTHAILTIRFVKI